MKALDIVDVSIGYGEIKAVKGVSLYIEQGEIVTLVGNNGAGKTTIMRAVSGLIKPSAGRISYCGKDVVRMNNQEIVRAGIQMVPEGRQVFPMMSVLENLEMGAFTRSRQEACETLDMVISLFPRLKERLHQLAGTLSGGEQQMLAIGRALMARPTLLLLDEPSLGLSPILVETIFGLIKQINETGTTVFLVEQNARMALLVSNRGYVLETGSIVASGTSEDLLNSEHVKNAYLGVGQD